MKLQGLKTKDKKLWTRNTLHTWVTIRHQRVHQVAQIRHWVRLPSWADFRGFSGQSERHAALEYCATKTLLCMLQVDGPIFPNFSTTCTVAWTATTAAAEEGTSESCWWRGVIIIPPNRTNSSNARLKIGAWIFWKSLPYMPLCLRIM